MRTGTVIVATALVVAVVASGSLLAGETRDLTQLERPVQVFNRHDAGWPSAGHDLNNTRHAKTENKISPANAGQLGVKWVFETAADISATPAVDQNSVYVPDWAGNLYRVASRTGELIWSHPIAEYTGQTFGLARATPALVGDRLILGTQLGDPPSGAWVLAVSKKDGSLLWKTQIESHFASIVTQSAVVHGDRAYVGVSSQEEAFAADPNYPCCSFRGSLVALDINTGEIVWKSYTSPDTSTGFSGNAVWGSTPVVDPKRRAVYVTTGNNYTAPDEVLDCAEAGGTPDELRDCVNAVEGSSENYFDALVAMDMDTGEVLWSNSVLPFDAWTVACFPFFDQENCPTPAGPDYDFGQGPALFNVGKRFELLGAGQKSGIYWAVNPDNGETVWSTQVGPGGELGGLQWGSAVDGDRIYVAVSNSNFVPHALAGGGEVKGGFWAALDAGTGDLQWETVGGAPPANPSPFTPPDAVATNQGPVTVANGVVFAGSMDPVGMMHAMDAATGEILWSFESGGSVNSGAAVVNGTVYWGSGYSNFGLGTPNNRLYAFEVQD